MIRAKKIGIMAALIFCTPLLGSATSTAPCGSFRCSEGKALSVGTGVESRLQYYFDPNACKVRCSCDTIAYMQIARVTNHDGTTKVEDGEITLRQVDGQAEPELNGWFIDAWVGEMWGYYGRYKTGNFDPWMIGLGSDSIPATLWDRSSGVGEEVLVEFVVVPVCLDSQATCKDKMLGASRWWYFVGKAHSRAPIDGPYFGTAESKQKEAIDLAWVKWNELRTKHGITVNEFPTGLGWMTSGPE
jgi:hypothetical protein